MADKIPQPEQEPKIDLEAVPTSDDFAEASGKVLRAIAEDSIDETKGAETRKDFDKFKDSLSFIMEHRESEPANSGKSIGEDFGYLAAKAEPLLSEFIDAIDDPRIAGREEGYIHPEFFPAFIAGVIEQTGIGNQEGAKSLVAAIEDYIEQKEKPQTPEAQENARLKAELASEKAKSASLEDQVRLLIGEVQGLREEVKGLRQELADTNKRMEEAAKRSEPTPTIEAQPFAQRLEAMPSKAKDVLEGWNFGTKQVQPGKLKDEFKPQHQFTEKDATVFNQSYKNVLDTLDIKDPAARALGVKVEGAQMVSAAQAIAEEQAVRNQLKSSYQDIEINLLPEDMKKRSALQGFRDKIGKSGQRLALNTVAAVAVLLLVGGVAYKADRGTSASEAPKPAVTHVLSAEQGGAVSYYLGDTILEDRVHTELGNIATVAGMRNEHVYYDTQEKRDEAEALKVDYMNGGSKLLNHAESLVTSINKMTPPQRTKFDGWYGKGFVDSAYSWASRALKDNNRHVK